MDPQARRQHILETATVVFATKGYHSASIADIIEKAGIARGTFYQYFQSKQEVFERILDDLLTEVSQGIERIDIKTGYDGVVRTIFGNLQRIFNILVDNKLRGRILMHTAVGLTQEIDEKLDNFHKALLNLIRHSLRLGMEMGIIRPVKAEVVAVAILGSLKELLYNLVRDEQRGQLEFSRDEMITELIEYNMCGLFQNS